MSICGRYFVRAALRAAIAAGVGCGIYRSLEEGCRMAVQMDDRVYEPNREHYKVYMENFEVYRNVYWKNKELF